MIPPSAEVLGSLFQDDDYYPECALGKEYESRNDNEFRSSCHKYNGKALTDILANDEECSRLDRSASSVSTLDDATSNEELDSSLNVSCNSSSFSSVQDQETLYTHQLYPIEGKQTPQRRIKKSRLPSHEASVDKNFTPKRKVAAVRKVVKKAVQNKMSIKSKRKRKESPAETSSDSLEVVPSGARWTEYEDNALKDAVNTYGAYDWKMISNIAFKATRNPSQCIHRWQRVLQPGLVKGPWTQEEDNIITSCIQRGMSRWTEIASKVPGRLGKQCRERWKNYLDPSIKKTEWTTEEDELLIMYQSEYGNAWAKIASMIPGRAENAVKNRWNSRTFRCKDESSTSCGPAMNSSVKTEVVAEKIKVRGSTEQPQAVATTDEALWDLPAEGLGNMDFLKMDVEFLADQVDGGQNAAMMMDMPHFSRQEKQELQRLLFEGNAKPVGTVHKAKREEEEVEYKAPGMMYHQPPRKQQQRVSPAFYGPSKPHGYVPVVPPSLPPGQLHHIHHYHYIYSEVPPPISGPAPAPYSSPEKSSYQQQHYHHHPERTAAYIHGGSERFHQSQMSLPTTVATTSLPFLQRSSPDNFLPSVDPSTIGIKVDDAPPPCGAGAQEAGEYFLEQEQQEAYNPDIFSLSLSPSKPNIL